MKITNGFKEAKNTSFFFIQFTRENNELKMSEVISNLCSLEIS